MSETKALFDTLRNSADPTVVAAIETVVRSANSRDARLCWFNEKLGLDDE